MRHDYIGSNHTNPLVGAATSSARNHRHDIEQQRQRPVALRTTNITSAGTGVNFKDQVLSVHPTSSLQPGASASDDEEETTDTISVSAVSKVGGAPLVTAQIVDEDNSSGPTILQAEVLKQHPFWKSTHCLKCSFIILILMVVTAAVTSVLSMPTGVPSMLAPTPPPTLSPTRPEEGRAYFQKTAELYNAIDEYLASETREFSSPSRRFGYPIGSWNVSLLTNFSRVFDPYRTLFPDRPFDPFRYYDDDYKTLQNGSFSSWSKFDEDLSGWDRKQRSSGTY